MEERRYSRTGGRADREMGDWRGGGEDGCLGGFSGDSSWRKASGEMQESFSSPRTIPVPISCFHLPNSMSAPSPHHLRHEDAKRAQ